MRRVTSTDGIQLAVESHGDPDRPTVICVHGYPDNRSLWNGVVPLLAANYHVVTYDVRGAGESDVPPDQHGYRLDQLADDFGAVLDAVSPQAGVHVLAHDWGSIQMWHAVTDPRFAERISSFTSISGPCLDHAGHFLRSVDPRRLPAVVDQLAHSFYIGFFQLPRVPEIAWRSGIVQTLLGRLDRSGSDPRTSDAVNGLGLYRENMTRRLSRPQRRSTDVPVQVLAPTEDGFVGTPLQTDIGKWASDLRVRHVRGGHWLPRTAPEIVARCTEELISYAETGEESRPLRRARLTAQPDAELGAFAGKLVLITGAGSGIGRATALEFASHGADLALIDIDAAAVGETAELVRELGVDATAEVVDVSSAAAMESYADASDVPDIVVNNAGIAVSGPFVDTSIDDWERVIDVNLWGVIHGCRVFGARMLERGEGGHIVNIASAAAYLPSKMLPAYATTKSAVLMLSECLRAEFAESGIGVSAICPGFVHTNITSSARFVGVSDGEQERLQQATTSAYARRGFGPERVAKEIVNAVSKDAAVTPVTLEARAGLVLSRITPGLLRRTAKLDLTSR